MNAMDRALEILILEDNPADAELVQRELRKAGINFVARKTADKPGFIKALEESSPDLILADYSLPGFDAMAALALARERLADVPVIIVSGAVGEETATEAIKAGATDYVLKNRLMRIGPVVQRAIREARQRREFAEAQQQLAQKREALLQSEETLRSLVNGVQDYAICLISPDGRVQSWNAGAQRILQWEAVEIIGRHIATFFSPSDVARGLPMRELEIATSEGKFETEAFRIRKDGSVFWAQINLTMIHNADGTPRGFATVVRDITAMVRADVDLAASRLVAERAREEAEAASKAKDHFLAVLSHELRTPLTAVLPALETVESMLSGGGRDDEKDLVEMARRNVEVEARLIDDLLDVTRIARGKVELDRRPVALCTIVQYAAEVCMPDIEARRLHFSLQLANEPQFIEADAARLQQVFWNLIKNAVKFTPHGGCVGVRVYRDRGGAVVEVCDSGVGIDTPMLSRIFNAFEQGDPRITRQFGGLGLGLAISKALVELHGGTLRAHSEGKDKGATFIVTLPLTSSPAKVPEGQLPRPGVKASPPGRSLRILLVEDHGDTARILRRVLQTAGSQVEHAGDVATALQLAGEHPFDLILSDLGLPDGSGVDLMRQLRARGDRTPAIALSGYGQEQDIQRSHEAGFAHHLMKPITPAQLMQTINGLCRSLQNS